MVPRQLGRTGMTLSPIGFGAFKIGRNEKIKYAQGYDLPSDEQAAALLNEVLDAGISYIDTAPAYGLSESRIGAALAHRHNEFVLSTKVGETFERGQSSYDFSAAAVRHSVQRSLARLKRDVLDIVFIHSDGRDLDIIHHSGAPETLLRLRDQGTIRAVGFSGKTIDGAQAALKWADAIMVEYNLNDRSHEDVIAKAGQRGVGVVVKKPLASGQLAPADAIAFILDNAHVTSMVIGGLNLSHIQQNIALAGG